MRIEKQQLEGRDHLVVPVVMLVEGVHAGSQGPLYYPADEIKKSTRLWNGRPIVAYHPSMDGGGGFADNPAVFNAQKVGVVFNTRYDRGKLIADAWLDVARLKSVDGRILDAIRRKEPMEVSTGLVGDGTQMGGVWNGEEYTTVTRNYRPDHLAILPDQRGACSLADGCGLVRNGTTGPTPLGLPKIDWSNN